MRTAACRCNSERPTATPMIRSPLVSLSGSAGLSRRVVAGVGLEHPAYAASTEPAASQLGRCHRGTHCAATARLERSGPSARGCPYRPGRRGDPRALSHATIRLKELPLYPEQRSCKRPTTEQILRLFSLAERHTLIRGNRVAQLFPAELTDLQHQVLNLLGVPEDAFRG
jgi:hypothetical protein